VESHRGSVSVYSAGEGRGSTFTVKLPLHRVNPSSVEDDNQPANFEVTEGIAEGNEEVLEFKRSELCDDLQESSASSITKSFRAPLTSPRPRLRVLVVDDATTSRKMLCKAISRRCLLAHEASDGGIAVGLVATSMENNMPYHAVLMDNEMPEMNGPEAAEKLRELGFNGCIIGVTGHISKKDKEEYISRGANVVLSKPVDLEHLEILLDGRY